MTTREYAECLWLIGATRQEGAIPPAPKPVKLTRKQKREIEDNIRAILAALGKVAA